MSIKNNLFIDSLEEESKVQILDLAYPDSCISCNEILALEEEIICSHCLYDLPQTHFSSNPENVVAQLFWSHPNIKMATSLYYFEKGNRLQNLIHGLKYAKLPQIGILLGEVLGKELKNSNLFDDVDYIVPVPLHPAKQRLRGYNQSEQICIGICESFVKQLDSQTLVRSINTETQTKKSKEERHNNVKNAFAIVDENKFQDKHILLVDDVITTGSTLLSIVETMEQYNTRISIASLAIAGI